MARAGNALIGALRISLGLDSAQFETGLKKSQVQMTNFARAMSHMGGALKAGLAGAAGALTVKAVADAVGGLVERFGDLADAAESAGVSAEFLQGLGAVAQDAGVEMDQVVNLMQVFNKELGEAAVKGGPLADVLKQNNVALKDANGNIRDQADLFFEVVGLISRTRSESEAAYLAQLAFSRASKQALAVLRQGPDAIKAGMKAAEDTGRVLREELVDAADELGDRWNRMWDAIAVSAAEKVIPVLDAIAKKRDEVWPEAEKEFAEGSSAFMAVVRAFFGWTDQVKNTMDDIKTIQAQINSLSAEDVTVRVILNQRLKEATAELQKQIDLQSEQGAIWERIGRGGMPKPATVIETEEDKKSREDADRLLQRQRESVTDLIEELEHERSTLNKNALQQEIANNLREAGSAATAEERTKIVELTTAIYEWNDSMDQAEKAFDKWEAAQKKAAEESKRLWEEIGNTMERYVLDVIDSLIDKTFTWRDALASALKVAASILGSIGNQSIQNAGGWGAILGMKDGGSFTVGGAGGIDSQLVQFMATPGEVVTVSHEDQMGGVTFAPSTYIDARGSTMNEAQMRAMLDARDRRWRDTLPGAFRKARAEGKV